MPRDGRHAGMVHFGVNRRRDPGRAACDFVCDLPNFSSPLEWPKGHFSGCSFLTIA
jgi:hypothetical protein